MNIAMIDIETLDTEPSAVILSIGVVELDGDQINASRSIYMELDITKQSGRTISADTLKWWSQQKAPMPIYGSIRLEDALSKLWLMYRGNQFWSNGSFDFDILNHACKQVGALTPWTFRDCFDYRTAKNLFPQIKADDTNDTAHHAFEDAKYQMNHLVKIFKGARNATI
jgi:hypothetical protein